jgi:hypothetical protein
VSDGTRTRDRLDHNQELYLLSYAHHADALSGDVRNLAVVRGDAGGDDLFLEGGDHGGVELGAGAPVRSSRAAST